MERTDYYILFDNFYELTEQYDADLANDLLNSVGEGEWQDDSLYWTDGAEVIETSYGW